MKLIFCVAALAFSTLSLAVENRLNGSWNKGCSRWDQSRMQESVVFGDDSAVASMEIFQGGPNCTGQFSIALYEFEYSKYQISDVPGESYKSIDMTFGGYFLTLKNADQVAKANRDGYCGGGWVLNVRRQITEQECNEAIPAVGAIDYNIFEFVLDDAGRSTGYVRFGSGLMEMDNQDEAHRPDVPQPNEQYKNVP